MSENCISSASGGRIAHLTEVIWLSGVLTVKGGRMFGRMDEPVVGREDHSSPKDERAAMRTG
jgi:hypothetical protein